MSLLPISKVTKKGRAGVRKAWAIEARHVQNIYYDAEYQITNIAVSAGQKFKRIVLPVQSAFVSQQLTRDGGANKVRQTLTFIPGLMNPTTLRELHSYGDECEFHFIVQTTDHELLYLGISILPNLETWVTESLKVSAGRGNTGQIYSRDVNEYALSFSTTAAFMAPFFVGDISSVPIEEPGTGGTGGVDEIAPEVISLLPPDNSTTAAAIKPSFSAVFNESIKPGTGDIELRLASDDSLIHSWDVTDSSVVVFDNNLTSVFLLLSPNLLYETEYYILIPSGAILDLAGNTFAGFLVKTDWNFTTITDPVTPAPQLTTLVPEDDSTEYDYSTISAKMTFDIPVKAGPGFATIYKDSDDSQVAKLNLLSDSRVTFNGSNTVEFDLSTLLSDGTTYYIIVDQGGIENMQGVAWVSTILVKGDWNFTTMVLGNPSITEYTPFIGETNTDLNTRIFFRTSEPVFAGTGTLKVVQVVDGTGPTDEGGNDILVRTFNVATSSDIVITSNQVEVLNFVSGGLTPGLQYYVTFPATAFVDSSGNQLPEHSLTGVIWYWTIAPAISYTYFPANGSTVNGTSWDSDPYIIGSKGVGKIKSGAVTVELRDYDTDTLLKSVTIDNQSYFLSQSTSQAFFYGMPITEGHFYILILQEGIVYDLDHGTPHPTFLDKDDWHFYYSADSTAPTTSSLIPSNGATGIDVDGPGDFVLYLTFGERVMPNQQQAAGYYWRIYDHDTGDELIRISTADSDMVEPISTEQPTATAQWTLTIPEGELANGKKYRVVVDSCAFIDRAGNCFGGIASGSWLFETTGYVAPTGDFNDDFNNDFN